MGTREDNTWRGWVIARVVLGNLQMIGAAVVLLLALQTGTSLATLATASVTVALTLTSLFLFRHGATPTLARRRR